MKLVTFVNQPCDNTQVLIEKQIKASKLKKQLELSEVWKITFNNDKTITINDVKMANDMLLEKWSWFEQNLSNWLTTVKKVLSWKDVRFKVGKTAFIGCQQIGMPLAIDCVATYQGKLSEYRFDLGLIFDHNESDLDLIAVLVASKMKDFANQCDLLLKQSQLNLKERELALRLDALTIGIRDREDEDDWSHHQGLCYDFHYQYLNLIDLKSNREIKDYALCKDSLNCQILALIKDISNNDITKQ